MIELSKMDQLANVKGLQGCLGSALDLPVRCCGSVFSIIIKKFSIFLSSEERLHSTPA